MTCTDTCLQSQLARRPQPFRFLRGLCSNLLSESSILSWSGSRSWNPLRNGMSQAQLRAPCRAILSKLQIMLPIKLLAVPLGRFLFRSSVCPRPVSVSCMIITSPQEPQQEKKVALDKSWWRDYHENRCACIFGEKLKREKIKEGDKDQEFVPDSWSQRIPLAKFAVDTIHLHDWLNIEGPPYVMYTARYGGCSSEQDGRSQQQLVQGDT